MNDINYINEKINSLENKFRLFLSVNSLPISFIQALIGRGFMKNPKLTGILKGNGVNAITAITPLSGTKVYYVSDSSGGLVTRKLTFTNGILTSET